MFKNYIKTALRNINRNRFISIINILGLGFGISIFLIIVFYVNFEFSYDKFNENYENIYRIEKVYESPYCGTPGMIGEMLTKEFPEIISFNRMDNYRKDVIKYNNNFYQTEKILLADSSFFNMFSYNILKGDEREILKKPFSIVMNESTATKIFGDTEPIGKTVLFNNKYELEVVGVYADMPGNSHIKANAILSIEILKDFYNDEQLFTNKGQWNYYTYLLTKDNIDKKALEQKITSYLREFFRDERASSDNLNFILVPLKDIYFKNIRGYEFESGNMGQMKLFLAVGIFVLLMALINFVNLTITQLYNRSKELGVRKVLGAKRIMIILQLIIESVVFSVIALNLSLVFIELLKPIFNSFLNFNLEIGYFSNPVIILYLIISGVLLGIIAGIFPALHVTNINPISALSNLVSHGKVSVLIRKVLIVIQFFIASVLIASTIIVMLQMSYIRNKDLGFDKDQLLYLKLNSDIRPHKDIFKDELLKHNNIENVSYSYSSYRISSEHWSGNNGEISYEFFIEFGDSDYLETLGLELIEGRNFSTTNEFDKNNFIINETGAKEVFNGNAIGKKIFGGEIVGVVKDYSFETLHKPIEPIAILGDAEYTNLINIKLKGSDYDNTIKYIQQQWEKFSPNFPFEFNFVSNYLDSKYRKEQQINKLFILFSIIAILIACLGVIGIISFTIQKKTKEIGIRKVNGANLWRIIIVLTSDLSKLIVFSFVISIPLSWYLMNSWVQKFAFHVTIPFWVFLLSFLIIMLITFLALSFQTYRASRLNPVDALRYE